MPNNGALANLFSCISRENLFSLILVLEVNGILIGEFETAIYQIVVPRIRKLLWFADGVANGFWDGTMLYLDLVPDGCRWRGGEVEDGEKERREREGGEGVGGRWRGALLGPGVKVRGKREVVKDFGCCCGSGGSAIEVSGHICWFLGSWFMSTLSSVGRDYDLKVGSNNLVFFFFQDIDAESVKVSGFRVDRI